MIAFTQLAIFATCLRVSEHLHNVTLVASFNGPGFPSTGELVIAVLIYIVLPAAVGIFFVDGYLAVEKRLAKLEIEVRRAPM